MIQRVSIAAAVFFVSLWFWRQYRRRPSPANDKTLD